MKIDWTNPWLYGSFIEVKDKTAARFRHDGDHSGGKEICMWVQLTGTEQQTQDPRANSGPR